RVAQPEQGEMVRRFGGTSVTISAPEVASALDRGVVDGIFTAGVGAVLWKDLLKFGYLIPVNWNNSYIIANAEAFNKLSPDLQSKVRKAAGDGAKWDQDTMKTEEAETVKVLTAAGYTMTTATPEEAAKVASTMQPYWDEWAKSRGPMVVEALGKVRAADLALCATGILLRAICGARADLSRNAALAASPGDVDRHRGALPGDSAHHRDPHPAHQRCP